MEEIAKSEIWERPERPRKPGKGDDTGPPTYLARDTCWLVADETCQCTYGYSDIRVKPRLMPKWFKEYLMPILMKECGLSERELWPDTCNGNMYLNGADSVWYHTDDEVYFSLRNNPGVIISFSLGATRWFSLKHYESYVPCHQIPIANGTFVAMEEYTQRHYMHAVETETNMPTTQECRRINFTFRWQRKHHSDCPAKSDQPHKRMPRRP